jgi:hypothetical protein
LGLYLTWNWAALLGALLAGGTALYIRLRWHRAPQAFTVMVAVAVCYFVAGAVLGAWVLHLLGPSAPSSAPRSSDQPPSGAPEQASPVPSAVASPELPVPGVSPSGYYCGTERWAVKTLSDEDRLRVNLKPVPSTVGQLIAFPRPDLLPGNGRAAPVELTNYEIRAVLLEVRYENDHDIHLVVADPTDQHKTMIAEIVDPGCSGATESPEEPDFKRVREGSSLLFGAPVAGSPPPIKVGDTLEITGVGFFDFEHRASGAAPNVIELHPVLDIRRVD